MTTNIRRLNEIIEITKLEFYRSNPPRMDVSVRGQVGHTGWSHVTLLRRPFHSLPADGIFEFDLVGLDAGGGYRVMTEHEAECRWEGPEATPDQVKGVRVYGEHNSILLMAQGVIEWAPSENP